MPRPWGSPPRTPRACSMARCRSSRDADRMPLRPLLAAAASLVAAAAIAAPAGAETYCVHQSGSCAAGTLDRGGDLEKALQDATASDVADDVAIGPGTYVGPFDYLGTSPLRIIGAGADQTTLTAAPSASDGTVLYSKGADVSHLHVRLSPSSSWSGVAAETGGLVHDITVDGDAGGKGRIGVYLRHD